MIYYFLEFVRRGGDKMTVVLVSFYISNYNNLGIIKLRQRLADQLTGTCTCNPNNTSKDTLLTFYSTQYAITLI